MFQVLGSGENWLGGNIAQYPGGGQKVKLLKEALQPFSEDTENLVLFVDRFVLVVKLLNIRYVRFGYLSV